MLNLTRPIFAAAILLGIVGIPSNTQSQVQSDKKERAGSVSGRVTINGKAAPGIVVGLRKHESHTSPEHTSYRDTTDGEGNYRISGIPAGNYRVAPLAPAFVLSDANAPSSSGKVLLITAGEVIKGIDFALVRGGVITGKVTDSEDRPLIEQGVNVIPVDPGSSFWGSHISWRMDLQTDDRGIYRIYGLPPGRYKVAVGESDTRYYSGDRRGARYKQTYHPNVNDPDKAEVIELGEGTEATNIDITVSQTVQLYSAKGRIVDGENGHPLAGIRVSLTRIFDQGSSGGGTGQNSNAQGEFLIENLFPGKYSVTIHASPESRLHADEVGFEIIDQDVTELVIRTSKSKQGVSLAGIVVLEGAQKGETTNFNEFYLSITGHSEATNSHWRTSTTLDRGGAFSFESLWPASQAYFSMDESPYNTNPRDMNKRYTVSRVERDGIIQPNIMQLQNGQHIKGLKIVIVIHPAGAIRGEVKVVNGTLPAGTRLSVHLQRSGERFDFGQPEVDSRGHQPEVDSRGHFVIGGLAAGSYEVVVNAYVPGSPQRWPSVKQLVHVEEGTVNDVRINFDLKQTSGPGAKP